MKLTREEAISNHRKMWRWISEETLKRKECVTKEDYFKENDIKETVKYNCFLCEYVKQLNSSHMYMIPCELCPLKWGDIGVCYLEEFDSWKLASDSKNYRLATEYAKIISELPEKEEK